MFHTCKVNNVSLAQGIDVRLAKVAAPTSTIAAMEAPYGKATALVPAETAKTIATAISDAKPSMEPLMSRVLRPTRSTIKTVMMVAIS